MTQSLPSGDSSKYMKSIRKVAARSESFTLDSKCSCILKKECKNKVPGSKIKDQNPNERLGATLISRSSGKLTPKLSASVNISSPRPVHFFEISPI